MRRLQTPNRKAYNREVARLMRAISRAKAQGFMVDDTQFLPSKSPKIVTKKAIERLQYITPSRIRAASPFLIQETGEMIPGNRGEEFIRTIQNRDRFSAQGWSDRRKELARFGVDINAYQYDPESGDIMYYSEDDTWGMIDISPKDITGRDKDELTSSMNKTEKQLCYDNFIDMLDDYPDALGEMFKEVMDSLINQGYEEWQIGESLQNMPSDIKEYLGKIGYGSGDALSDFTSELLDYLPGIDESNRQQFEDMLEEISGMAVEQE